jgi:DNA-binding GntR family transcriptional regulator
MNGPEGVNEKRKQSRTGEVYGAIKERIICLQMPPGSHCTEGRLAQELGSSKTPVREALVRLEHEGLVQVSPRLGYSVTPVTLRDVRDLFELRVLLEGEAAALATSRIGEATQLRMIEDAASIEYDQSDIAQYLRGNIQFHTTLAHAGGNERLVHVIQEVLDQMTRLFHLSLALTTRAEELVNEHRTLIEAVKSGDVRHARELAAGHIRTSQTMVIEALLCSDALLSTNVTVTPYTQASHEV